MTDLSQIGNAAPPPASQPSVIYVSPPPTPPSPPKYLTEEEVQRMLNEERERVRSEEKNKLYPTIETLEAQLKVLTEEREAKLAAEQEAERLAAEAEKNRLEEEKDLATKFDEYRFDQEKRINELIAQREADQAIMAKERELATLSEYRTRRLVEEADNIIPQLLDLVRGSTQQEIDASIEEMKSRSEAIFSEVQEAQQQQRRTVPLPVSGQPPVESPAPGGTPGRRELSADDIREMSLEEYAQLRPQLLEAQSSHVRERGLYGG